MKNRFHSPPAEIAISAETPLVFLAGPIQGAPDWQSHIAHELIKVRDDIEVASPRRHDDMGFPYEEQVAWEKRHLARSAEMGSVAFWFASKDAHIEYEEGRAYAQTSRIEIGRLFGWHDYKPFPLIVGFDKSYSASGGGSQRYIELMCTEKNIQVASSLEELIEMIKIQTPRSGADL